MLNCTLFLSMIVTTCIILESKILKEIDYTLKEYQNNCTNFVKF